MRRLLAPCLFLSALCAGILAGADNPPPAAEPLFLPVWRVFTSPRCRNCHPAGDAPLQRDEGIPHAMNVTRLSERNGLRCSTCHRRENAPLVESPPGRPRWELPPARTPMVIEGRSPHDLCLQLKDPRQTAGANLAALLHHVETEALVLWAWNPGADRTPPPVSHEAFVAAFRAWVGAGAPCP